MLILGRWRTVLMHPGRRILTLTIPSAGSGLDTFSGSLRNVPGGRWAYYVSLKDKATGLKAASPLRRVRVP